MAIIADTVSGTTGSICSVSPSDIVGQVDNLLSRIEELEQKVNELSTQNVSANQLSDISNQGGWIYNVTYMGTEGWTQTAAGTLIPPPGVSLSSLGLMPTADNSPGGTLVSSTPGGITFSIDQLGNILGVDTGGNADYAWTRFTYGGSNTNNSRNITITLIDIGTDFADVKMDVTQDGLYLVIVYGDDLIASSQTLDDGLIISVNGTSLLGLRLPTLAGGAGGNRSSGSVGGLLNLSAGDEVHAENDPSSLTVEQVMQFHVSLFRISG